MTDFISNEIYRPKYHYSPKAGWMNDPNGMVYYNDEYHLFYQYYPDGLTWGKMHWGHAVSKDLIYWEELPIALSPDHNGWIFSGSIVVDQDNTSGLFHKGSGLVAIFTHADQEQIGNRPLQRQSIAYSNDSGRTWQMYANNPVLINYEAADFRDPKVMWYSELSYWVMTLAIGDRIHFYRSSNLIDWVFLSEFGSVEGSHEGVWECPDLIQLPIENSDGVMKWVLIVSIGAEDHYPKGSRTQYFIGDFDGVTFINELPENKVLWLDYGRDNYAGVTWTNKRDDIYGEVFIGWMNNWKYANVIPANTSRGAMTLPRILTLSDTSTGLVIMQRLIDSIDVLRKESQREKQIKLDDKYPIWAGPTVTIAEIETEITVGDAKEIGLTFRNQWGEYTSIKYDVMNEKLIMDRSNSGQTGFHEMFSQEISKAVSLIDGKLHLHIFIDSTSIELFVNKGESVLTNLIFPSDINHGIELYSIHGTATVEYINIHQLQSS